MKEGKEARKKSKRQKKELPEWSDKQECKRQGKSRYQSKNSHEKYLKVGYLTNYPGLTRLVGFLEEESH